jgi:CRP-like cAMP-binding protein
MHPLREHIEKIVLLTDEEFSSVLTFFRHRNVRKHQYLVQAGDSVHDDFFVLSGCMKAFLTGSDGKEHILQFALADWWITDYQAYFNAQPASLHIDCIEAGEVLSLSLSAREQLCVEVPKMERFFRKKSSAGYVALQQRILSLLTTSAAERYAQILQQQPQLIQKIPKTLLAAYLGVSRETLSRLGSK